MLALTYSGRSKINQQELIANIQCEFSKILRLARHVLGIKYEKNIMLHYVYGVCLNNVGSD